MANGIKKIVDYNDDECYRRKTDGPHCTFVEPCCPEFHIGDGRSDNEFDYIRFTWGNDVRTKEHEPRMQRWALFYRPEMHQIITFEDGTEWEISTQNKEADLEKIKDYINNGYEFYSEMSKAARLLDDDMMYEI